MILILYLNFFLQTGMTFWPLVQTFNFAVIPERNRVAFVGVASFVWTAYLSFMKASGAFNSPENWNIPVAQSFC